MSRKQPAGWEFPGAPTFLILAGVFLLVWPWMLLAGAARLAVGIPWTGIGALIAVAAIVGKVREHQHRA